MAAATAQPVAGQEIVTKSVPAAPEGDAYVKDKSLLLGGIAKTIGHAGGKRLQCPPGVCRTLRRVPSGHEGAEHQHGFCRRLLVPPDVANEVIELLRARTAVRSSGPRIIPMPRGTMTLPGQASAATASYGSEGSRIRKSEQTVRNIVASFKKLTALVPVSNDMMRYANPAMDAFVRDDLVKVMALTEDQSFILGDGTQDTPRGFLSFANSWVGANNGTVGVWNTAANSTFAVNGPIRPIQPGATSSPPPRPIRWPRSRRNWAAPSTVSTRRTYRKTSVCGSCIRAATTTCSTCRTRSASTSIARS